MSWDPATYLRFADHRIRPGLELMARIPLDAPRLIVDLGCGTGHLTADLARRWPEAHVIGVDSSVEMLGTAASLNTRIEWVQADVEHWIPPSAPDLVYSNAALHWLGGHDTLFPRMAAWVAPGGSLAVQMPDNWREPTHTIPARILDEAGWPDAARDALMRDRVREPAFYRDLLVDRFETIDLWTTTYHQVLEGADPVLGWVKGSVLRPVLGALDEPRRTEFHDRCAAEYRDAYPPSADGSTVLRFSRFFVVASAART